MNEDVKKVLLYASGGVVAFIAIVLLLWLFMKYKAPCNCNGGGVPALKPDDGTAIQPQPAPVDGGALSFYQGSGFDLV